MTVDRSLWVAVAAVLLCSAHARADRAKRRLRHDDVADGAIAGGAIATWIVTQVYQPALAPSTCRWCATNGFDLYFRDHLRWSRSGAGTLSNVFAFAAAPVGVLGLDAFAEHQQRDMPQLAVDVLVIAESVGLAMDMNQLVKDAVGRQRPFVWALPPAERPLTSQPSDNNVSFYSGHAAFTFSLVTATAMVAHQRRLRIEPWIWAVGLPLAATAGYLRIAADKHWMTDVLAGAALGSVTGWAIPSLWHTGYDEPAAAGSASRSSRLLPTGNGVAWVLAW